METFGWEKRADSGLDRSPKEWCQGSEPDHTSLPAILGQELHIALPASVRELVGSWHFCSTGRGQGAKAKKPGWDGGSGHGEEPALRECFTAADKN